MRGRPPKPIKLHKAAGSYRRDRHGGALDITTSGAPVKPSGLGEHGDRLWESVVTPLVEVGVATEVDTASLAGMCEWYQRYRDCADVLDRTAPDDRSAYRLTIQTRMCWQTFESMASQFGLSPASRARLRAPSNDG